LPVGSGDPCPWFTAFAPRFGWHRTTEASGTPGRCHGHCAYQDVEPSPMAIFWNPDRTIWTSPVPWNGRFPPLGCARKPEFWVRRIGSLQGRPRGWASSRSIAARGPVIPRRAAPCPRAGRGCPAIRVRASPLSARSDEQFFAKGRVAQLALDCIDCVLTDAAEDDGRGDVFDLDG
jgi:hypothetical protein